MTYVIHYRWRDHGRERRTAEKASAREALTEAENIQRSDAEIEYIDTPTEGRVDMVMLRVLAEEEERQP